MIAVTILLATTLLAAVGGLVYFAKLAIDHADAAAQATAQRDAATVQQANAATAVVDAERQADEDRLHGDERTTHDDLVAVADGAGNDPLLASLAAHPALSAEHHSASPGMPAPAAGGSPGSAGAGKR